jgi:TonB family protein
MKLLTGKRVGQSGQELVVSVLFSFLLHLIILFGALFLYVRATPKVDVPPFYEVMLVGQPAGAPEILPPVPSAPPEQKQATKKGASAKGGMPGLKKQKAVPEYVAEDEVAGSENSSKKQEAVAVTTPQDFKFPPYLAIIRVKIGRNWNPPPGAKGIRAKVQFTILRSGRVVEPDIVESSGNFYFDQAALRAIQSSSPFPQLPEEFFQEQVMLSADLMEKE